ncbi:nitrous oxide reductase accessory protein NosL [Terrihabitans sp. B22-R8]|uniref:nitrous oxide reductase accessory protein NosL n=1 Tax=Terrihabitans sp. B22-R8 TaxID=3425128 RepID=UPI00403CE258
MRKSLLAVAVLGAFALAGCNDEKAAEAPPPPQEMTRASIGHYCGMNVLEHTGPKGQIILASRKDAVWFSSARDAISFTMLPEEPKDVRAIYVSDMSKAPNWDQPGTTNWVDAKKAFFVVGSRMKGGMGADEAVPFSDQAAAEKFAGENGGEVKAFDDLPQDYILSAATETPEPADTDAEPGAGDHSGHSDHSGHEAPAPAGMHAH